MVKTVDYEHSQLVFRAKRDAAEGAAHIIARKVADDLSYIRYCMRHPALIYGITIEQRAAIDANNAIAVCQMAKSGRKLVGSALWKEILGIEIRWHMERSAEDGR